MPKHMFWADEYTGRERAGHVAEGASRIYESLRQKDSYRTHLWRMLVFIIATKEESRYQVNFQVPGQRILINRGFSVFFCAVMRRGGN